MHKARFCDLRCWRAHFFYSTFVAWTLEPHNLFLLITFSLLLLYVFFFYLFVTHILAHHRFATTALYYFQLLHAPNVSKTIL